MNELENISFESIRQLPASERNDVMRVYAEWRARSRKQDRREIKNQERRKFVYYNREYVNEKQKDHLKRLEEGNMNASKEATDFYKKHVEKQQKILWNTIKLNKNWTLKTKLTTAMICIYASASSLDFATEVKLINGKRADIIIPGISTPVIEILDSETPDMFVQNKTPYYFDSKIGYYTVMAGDESAWSAICKANGLAVTGRIKTNI